MEIDFGQVAGPRKGNDQSDELEAWKASFSGRKAPGNSNLWHGQPSRVSSLSTRFAGRSSLKRAATRSSVACFSFPFLGLASSERYHFRCTTMYLCFLNNYNASRTFSYSSNF